MRGSSTRRKDSRYISLFFLAHSLITNGTVTVLVGHHWQVEWPASITAWSTLLAVRLADTVTLS